MNRRLPIFIMYMVLVSTSISVFASDYYPLKVGQYRIWATLDSVKNVLTKDSLLIDSVFTSSGIQFYRRTTASKPIGNREQIFFIDSGNTVFYTGSVPITIGRHRYNEGDEFVGVGGGAFKVHYIGSRTVYAGSFDSCWFAYYKQVPQAGFIYAPNIGVIEQLGINGQTVAELRSFGNVIISPTTVRSIQNRTIIKPGIEKRSVDLFGRLQTRRNSNGAGIVIRNGKIGSRLK